MKVKVRLDKIGDTLDSLVEGYLTNAKLPECLGNMIPPLLSRVIEVDQKWFALRGCTPAKEIAVDDVSELLVRDRSTTDITDGDDFILTHQGAEKIEGYKKERAEAYAMQIVKCAACPQTEVCFKLTTNYLSLLNLENKNTMNQTQVRGPHD